MLIFTAYVVVAWDFNDPAKMAGARLSAATIAAMQKQILSRKPDMEQFRLRGPFAVDVEKDQELRISLIDVISTDLYLARHGEKAPLAIIQHGYDNSKEDHANQAMHLASWGIHSLCLQLPNKGPWIATGQNLARIVQIIHRQPDLIDSRIDTNKIILIGHSFGGAAAAVALAEKAPAVGAILLDPATASRRLPEYLRRINKPVLILGADERISPVRNRDYFFRNLRSSVTEVSIKDALHEDAEFPSRSPEANDDTQLTFVTALTSAAFSLSSTGKFDYAWRSFGNAIKSGKFLDPKKK